MKDPFVDIRPYHDSEVAGVIGRILGNPEFVHSMSRLRFGRLASYCAWALDPLVRTAIKRQVAGVQDVAAMQMLIEKYMDRMIHKTTSGFSITGLDALPADEAYLLMSNHRDIAMDPAFINYALHQNNRETVRIAIGDNLLTKPWVSDLMRLNKSFIVKRSAKGPRQVLAAYRNLSAYIHHSLCEERAPVWIAQREGRAKDGVDRTEPALIKMLAMNCDKQTPFADYIASLKIVPVAISYELDPCDGLKAAELAAIASQGNYEKGEHEDVKSIAAGITGAKGQVHVSFGQPLPAEFDSPDAVAKELDRQITELYCLHPTNKYAYEALHGRNPAFDGMFSESGDISQQQFAARINEMPVAHRNFALAIYANAVVSKLER